MIGVEGEWDPQDPDLVDWALGMSDEPTPRVVEPIDGSVWVNSWKAPGCDGICGFWWKNFHQAAVLLGRTVWDMLEGDSEDIPTWFVKGRTVLIPKAVCEGRPDQYRPITCLNTAYKLLTAVMTEVLHDHVMAHAYLPLEQRAIRRGHRGCLDALMVDYMVAREAMVRRRNLSVAWRDYQKAYDRVPHAWLSEVLSIVRAPLSVQHTLPLSVQHTLPLSVQHTLARLRQKCSSVFCVGTGDGTVMTELTYRRGVFQGDSLSPLLYCQSIAPISHAIRKTAGYCVPYLDYPVLHGRPEGVRQEQQCT